MDVTELLQRAEEYDLKHRTRLKTSNELFKAASFAVCLSFEVALSILMASTLAKGQLLLG